MSKHRRKRRIPSDPVERARLDAETRRDPSKWGLDRDALALPANDDVEVHDLSRRNMTRARRYDIFALMFFHPRPRLSASSYDAVRRLQKDLAILHRTEGTSDAIRCTSAGNVWLREGLSLARREAGERIEAVLSGMEKPWARTLIQALCESEVIRGQPPNWQFITHRVTGEIDRHARGNRVREACDDLAQSYRTIDYTPKGHPMRSLAFA